MKTRIAAALALLTTAADDVRPGTRGEIDFKQALVELQGAMDMPEPEVPKPTLTQDQLEQIGQSVNDLFTGILTRLGNVEAAAGSILTVTQASADKLDGFEDALGVIVANTTPDPAPAA